MVIGYLAMLDWCMCIVIDCCRLPYHSGLLRVCIVIAWNIVVGFMEKEIIVVADGMDLGHSGARP
jgi:hypothetical protein